MHWEFLVALIIAIPVIILPAALIWYLNIGGLYAAAYKVFNKQATPKEQKKVAKVRRLAD